MENVLEMAHLQLLQKMKETAGDEERPKRQGMRQVKRGKFILFLGSGLWCKSHLWDLEFEWEEF